MKFVEIVIIISLGFSVGCSKDTPVKSDCIEAMLNENNMTAYDGQALGQYYSLLRPFISFYKIPAKTQYNITFV